MKKRILTLIICFALAFVISGEMLFSVKASAETVSSYSDTKIEDDISHLDFTNYPRNASGECEIVYFTEYCYSVNSDVSSHYGLYVYVYNPTEKEITITDLNKVNIAVAFGDNGEASEYLKLSLLYVDKTDNNRFYKFKITDSQRMLSVAQKYASAHNGIRRYELIELETVYGSVVKASGISKIYEYSGYGAYCDKDRTPMSSLVCKDYGARSIHLELDHTNYRFAVDEKTCISDELNSVYFSVPESYFNEFGDLTKIAAEWYEYKTKYMFVTSDDGAYAALKDLRNIRINEFGQKIDENGQVLDAATLSYWRVFWFITSRTIHSELTGADSKYYIGNSFNGKCREDVDDDGIFDFDGSDDWTFGYWDEDKNELTGAWDSQDYLNWLFLRQEVEDSEDYRVSRQEVEDYMKDYTKLFPGEELVLGKYASSLFVDSIDTDRLNLLEDYASGATSGYIQMEFDINDVYEFLDTDREQSKWNKFWHGQAYDTYPYSPIVTLSAADLDLSDDAFSEKFYVGKEDVKRIKENARKDLKKDKVPVLLRFAITDYYASTARFDYAEEDAFEMSEQDGYVAQETVFLNFDVISLTFVDPDGAGAVVIGAVSDPIDIINGLTPPSDLKVEETSWFKIVVRLVLLIAACVLLIPLLTPFCKFVVEGISEGAVAVLNVALNIIVLPFNLIAKIFKSNNRRR